MKFQHLILLTSALILLNTCKRNTEADQQTNDTTVAVVQTRDSVAVKDTTQINSSATEEKNTTQVSTKQDNRASGTAYYKLNYCGGVRPTPEMEEEFRKEYPLASQKIKFVNVYDETDYVITSTDASGRFSVGLHEGVYDYYFVFTPGSSLPPNPNCQKYYERTYGKVFIDPGNWSGFKLLYAFPCDPCSPPRP